MKKTYNLKDVATHAGVSLGTASKVLNKIYVKPDLRVRVEAAMKELNYTPNAIARSLKANTTQTIGIIIPDISSPVIGKVTKGIEDISREAGYKIIICQTALNPVNESQAIDILSKNKVDGIIYLGNTVTDDIAGQLKAAAVPVVFVMTDYINDDKYFSSVTIDNEAAAFTAVDYLCQKGHREILMLAGEIDDPNAGIPRYNGYRRALDKYHIKFDERLVIHGSYRLNRGYRDIKKVTEGQINYTAIFAVSDEVAIGAVKALTEAGIKVPDQVSVMGFDGIEMIDYITPSLSSISQPFYDLGKEAVTIFIDCVRHRKAAVRLVLPYKLLENQSIKER